MSDDGYYADSPYDDFEEMLGDADSAPHLADDLAQHTACSPVWQDDPVGELEVYHSDWDYYSDDYFDDDPAILKTNPLDGGQPRRKSTSKAQVKRGRKRKVNEAFAALDSVEQTPLAKTIRGTVWADNVSPTLKIFRDGEQEKVALLIDWRERFKIDTKRRSISKREQTKGDESWANDLGLADMGLTYVGEREATQHDAESAISDADEETGREEVEEDTDDEVIVGDLASVLYEKDIEGDSTEISMQQIVLDVGQSTVTDKSLDVGKSGKIGEENESQGRKRLKMTHSDDGRQGKSMPQTSDTTHGRKKRRLSSTSDDAPSNAPSTVGRHTKRIASSKLGRT